MSSPATPKPPPPAAAERRRPPGMTDVARLAGVSQKTVSRVVNNERYVSEDLREKVLRAAAELGFRPNTAARALITGRFRRIGVVSLGSALFGPASARVALERATRAAGFAFLVANTAEGEPDGIQDAVDWLLAQGVDGIILSEPIDEGQHLRPAPGVPVVSLGQAPGLPDRADRVRPRPHRRLLQRGRRVPARPRPRPRLARRRTPGVVGGPRTPRRLGRRPPRARHRTAPAPRRRLVARRRVRRRARPAPRSHGRVLRQRRHRDRGHPSALREAGRRVPEDVSVAGFDDIPAAAYLSPPLTTVRQDFEADAIHGLNLLLRLLPGAAAPEADDTDAAAPRRLIVRDSTAAPLR